MLATARLGRAMTHMEVGVSLLLFAAAYGLLGQDTR